MKIIIIPNEPNPNMTGRHYGIAKNLIAHGHEVHTLVWDLPQLQTGKQRFTHLWRSLTSDTRTYEDLTLHKIRRLPYFWPILNGWLFKRQLRKLFSDLDADLIFTMSYTNETTVPEDLPYIYDLADDYAAPAIVFGSPLYRLMFAVLGVKAVMRRQCRHALAVTAVSDTLCAYAEQYSSRVIKLPNGVETDIIEKLEGISVKPHSLIYVTGFGQWSRPLELMQAVVKLRSEIPDLTLTLVGEGSEVAAMQAFITEHNAGSYIQYRGFLHDRKEVFTLIAQHEVGLNISEKNAWRDAAHPMKVIEYSALGKKVVSTDLTGVTSLGLPNVFTFSDKEGGTSLITALRSALRAPSDDPLYENVREQVLARYNWDRVIDRLERLIDWSLTEGVRRIVHVTPAYPPNLGGLEKVVQVLATTESKLGENVSVITSNKGLIDTPVHDDIPVNRLKSFVLANTTLMPCLFTELLRLTKQTMVHLHVTQAFTPEMVWLAAKRRHFKYIAHIHLDVPPSGPAGFLLKLYKPLFLKRVLQSAEFVIVFTSDQQRDTAQQYDLPLERVKVMPNGVEEQFYYNEPRHVHERPRLLFVGRLGYQKNLPLLLRSLNGISDKFETTLLGDGDLREELEAQTKELLLQNVTFSGRADGEKLLDYYRKADIFVLPSEREGMPLVLLEAMAMGLPIVATDVTGSKDVVVHERNGLLVPFNDQLAFRDALLRLRDDATYVRLHKEARRMADEYAWDKIARQFQEVYKESGW